MNNIEHVWTEIIFIKYLTLKGHLPKFFIVLIDAADPHDSHDMSHAILICEPPDRIKQHYERN